MPEVLRIKVYDLPEASRNSKGTVNCKCYRKLPDEKVTALLPVKEFTDSEYTMMCTLKGTIKKTDMTAFSHVRQNGIIAINLEDGDKLIGAEITDGNCDVIIGTHEGLACRFRESDVRAMGRTAAGVRGISLAKSDYVISMIIIRRSDSQVLVVSENGYGKRTKFEDFRLTKRGLRCYLYVSYKLKPVKWSDSCRIAAKTLVLTVNGILIRQILKNIRTIGRKLRELN